MTWLKKAGENKYVIVAVLCLVTLPSVCFSWSKQGHEWIANQSFEQLSENERRYYQRLLVFSEALTDSPNDIDSANIGSYLSSFSSVASFPDRVRALKLSEVFANVRVDIPGAMKPYEGRDTKDWHYVNFFIETPENRHCRKLSSGQLLAMLKQLDLVLEEDLSPEQEAILLSFQIHLIQDIHQPLHTFTAIDSRCESDLGGNRTCVVKEGGVCRLNLHALWDRGFGLFEGERTSLPILEINTQFRPEAWAEENLKHYTAVYALDETDYESSSKKNLHVQVEKAVFRLTEYLKRHYKRHEKK